MSDFPDCKRDLWAAIDEARAAEPTDRKAAEALLERPVIRLGEVVARRRCVDLPPTADADYIQSIVTQAVWEAIGRVQLSRDTRQVFQFFVTRAAHAVSDAARDADPLPRRARAYRNRVLLVADQRGERCDERSLRRLAHELYPHVHPQTLELMVRGAPPPINIDRPDVAPGLVETTSDPNEDLVRREMVDAVHVAMCDQPDPDFRAWAASVLDGETVARRVPGRLRDQAFDARDALLEWAG